MIERLYVNNYRCLENFSIDLTNRASALVIGKNGSGKSTLRHALGVLQKVCRGPNRVRLWIDRSDFTRYRTNIPMRFELDLVLTGKRFQYVVALDLPENLREPRVVEESLAVNGSMVFSRHLSKVTLPGGSTFGLDWHVAALPVIDERPGGSSVRQLRAFLASLILIAPVPARMSGFAEEESVELQEDAENFAAALNALLSQHPAAYSHLISYLQSVIPDLDSFGNVLRGEKGKQLQVSFVKERGGEALALEFKKLSDGEKCFFLSALIATTNKMSGPIFCMWDEPDNHLSLSEVSHFVIHLRKLTNQNGQLIVTSHHPSAIRRFSDENTLVFTRKSHLEPTVVRPLTDFQYSGDLIEALVRDEVIG